MQLILQRDKPISIMQTRSKKKKKKPFESKWTFWQPTVLLRRKEVPNHILQWLWCICSYITWFFFGNSIITNDNVKQIATKAKHWTHEEFRLCQKISIIHCSMPTGCRKVSKLYCTILWVQILGSHQTWPSEKTQPIDMITGHSCHNMEWKNEIWRLNIS